MLANEDRITTLQNLLRQAQAVFASTEQRYLDVGVITDDCLTAIILQSTSEQTSALMIYCRWREKFSWSL